jgi:tetratricopeptide (TPR) repeat protein
LATTAISQNDLLAKNYFEQGDFEKALVLYEKLFEKNPYRTDYLLFVVESHQQLEQFEQAENLLKEKLNGRNINPQLYIELGYNYSLQNMENEANMYYDKALAYIDEVPNYANAVGNHFEKYSLLDRAIEAYQKGMALDPKKDFNMQLARIYGEQGALDKMFETYINLMEGNPAYRSIAQRYFSYYVTDDPTNTANEILRKALLRRLQQQPELLYNELLSWLFIQQKDYGKAFIQEKAIYRRSDENMRSIVDLALIAIDDEAYETASEIITFIIENSYTPEAKLQAHQYNMKIALKTTPEREYASLREQFESLLETFGKGPETYLLQVDYNHFLAFDYEKQLEAIANLKDLLQQKLTAYQEARVKMELADILVFDEKFNEALIYYSQIQKKVQSDLLAQEARFKVARTSYFKGDFEWAQIQLDVLKKSTSQLIANDAMQLSLMITDNSLEDSTQTALKKYAKADLLALRNKNEAAIQLLEGILQDHKGEKIEDEALLKLANLYKTMGAYEKAAANYEKILEFYGDDILADDAYFHLANLYHHHLGQPEKAKDLYEQLIYNFADSIYFVAARDAFRRLRGDAIN